MPLIEVYRYRPVFKVYDKKGLFWPPPWKYYNSDMKLSLSDPSFRSEMVEPDLNYILLLDKLDILSL